MGCASSSPVKEPGTTEGITTVTASSISKQQQQQQRHASPTEPAAAGAAAPPRAPQHLQSPIASNDKSFSAHSPLAISALKNSAGLLNGSSQSLLGASTANNSPDVQSLLSPHRESRKSLDGLARKSVENVNGLFALPGPRERRISIELTDLALLDSQGRLSVEFSKDLRESFSGARVSASLQNNYNKHVLVYGNDGGPPVLLKRLVGKGGFGSVFVGEWDGREVAVKVVAGRKLTSAGGQSQHEQMTQLEAILMTIVDHENVIKTFKVMCGDDDEGSSEIEAEKPASSLSFYIIMENARFGSLWAGLVMGRFHNGIQEDISRVCWDAWAALETLKDVAAGCIYLHGQGVIHGDLKAANMLLCASFKDRRGYVGKVTDFGFSRITPTSDPRNFSMHSNTYGTVTHMPPELLAKGQLTFLCDVFSFGVVMWEVYTGQAVFKDLTDAEVISKVICEELRPQWPADAPAHFKALAVKCWDSNKDNRPSMEELMAGLQDLQKEMCPHGSRSAGIIIAGTVSNYRRKSLQGLSQCKSHESASERKVRRQSLGAEGADGKQKSTSWI